MDRVYQANAIETPPSTTASSGSYPTAGNKASGQLATVPGPYWFYSITEEIRNALIAAGVTPDAAKVNQLAEAMRKFLPLSGGTMTGNLVMHNGCVIENDDNTGWTRIYGGDSLDNGGRIQIAGKDNASNPGEVWLVANNGVNAPALKVFPNGKASINGSYIDAVNSIGTNYVRYENGLQICFGYSSVSGSGTTITYPVAFTSTPFTVAIQSTATRMWSYPGTSPTTSFYAEADNSTSLRYHAIGYWK